ncbi:Fn3-like domain-containing protein [Mycena chlorophos]|uniref:beta-glucosidase n=1 Tax=Mycena chlorophos TaxID=658473 RepID=A0A8H6TK33_MYCCL|nr:Fn3-like domain-containing protein [Mycena chlorophos]
MKGSKELGGGIRITSRRRPYERPVGAQRATIRREREAAGMEQGPDNMELDGESDTEMQDFSFLGGDIDMPHAPVVQPAQVELFHFIMAQHSHYPVTYPGDRVSEGTAEISAPDNAIPCAAGAQMDPIADGMEDWDYLVEQEGPDAVYNPPEGVPVRYKKVYVVDIFQEGFREVPFLVGDDRVAPTLVKQGLIPCTPIYATVAFTTRTLAAFHAMKMRCPRLGKQAFLRSLNDIHGIAPRPYMQVQFSVAYDVYLRGREEIRIRVARDLGRDSLHWRLKNACPACLYKVQGQPELNPPFLCTHDGNSALKRVESRHVQYSENGEKVVGGCNEVPDDRKTPQDYYLEPEVVNRFAKNSPEVAEAMKDFQPNPNRVKPDDGCGEGWHNMKAHCENLTDKARGIFKETGLFASFCRHSVTLVLVDMIESGESAKYGLSITCHLLAVLGKHVLGYDIGCKFEQDGMGLDAVENAENIFSKSNALAGTTRHASAFHRRQDIVNYFSHSDNFDALANIVSLIHNKYRRALEVLSKEEDLLDYMNTNNITERSLEMGVLEDFDLLRLGREDIRDAAWAQPGARVAMDLHFRLLRAHEEILRCNVEIKQFSTWMKEEREFLVYQELRLVSEGRDARALQIRKHRMLQGRFFAIHRERLEKLRNMEGFTGDIEPRVGDQEAEIVQALQQVAQEEEQDGGDGTGAQDDEDHEDEEECTSGASIIAGLDLEMGSDVYYTTPLYDDIYVNKNLSESYLDRAVHRILSMYDRFGFLDGRGPQGNSTSSLLTSTLIPDSVFAAHEQIAYNIAVASGVLLKNNGVLPLTGKSVAIIGPTGLQLTNGVEKFDERSYGRDSRKVSPFDALKQRAPRLNVSSSTGLDLHGSLVPSSSLQTPDGRTGLLRNDGTVDQTIFFANDSALPANVSYTWTGQILANETGYHRIALQRSYPPWNGVVNASDFMNPSLFSVTTLEINGTAFTGYRIDLDGGARPLSAAVPTLDGWDENGANVYLEQGWHNISLTVPALFGLPVQVRLHWTTPADREATIQAAVSLASQIHTPIVFAYSMTPAEVVMQLMPGFDELISRVAAANPNTVVVLNNGDPVVMPWLNSTAAVLWMGHPGQEGGWATADLLLGNHNPQGRLPVTYPASANTSLTRNPAFPERVDTASGTAIFDEGLNVGYRYYIDTNTPVLFPFGYGLSYTTFAYSGLHISKTADAEFAVSFAIHNTGSRTGGNVPQLYIGPPSTANTTYADFQFAASALVAFDATASLGAQPLMPP